jgi:hypothetical protein
VKAFLPHLIKWLEERDYPFEFSTEASLNLSDDKELLGLLRKANFFLIFVGIESPDTETLIAMKKKQNTRRSIPESVHRIYEYGIFVTAGFIVGFDSERGSVAEPMLELIEDAAIPMAVIGLLFALANTQLTRRLAREGRLFANSEILPKGSGDQMAGGMNFQTKRPRLDVLRDFRRVLHDAYTPEAYCRRIDRMVSMLDCTGRRRELPKGDRRAEIGTFNVVQEILRRMPEHKEIFWRTFTKALNSNPGALRAVVTLMGFYLHVGPYTRYAVSEIDKQIALLESDEFVMPALAPPVTAEAASAAASAA